MDFLICAFFFAHDMKNDQYSNKFVTLSPSFSQ